MQENIFSGITKENSIGSKNKKRKNATPEKSTISNNNTQHQQKAKTMATFSFIPTVI